MSATLRKLQERFLKMPFPRLGGTVGHFLRWDSIMAGIASSVAQGQYSHWTPENLPSIDEESEMVLGLLETKANPSDEERDFIKYAKALDEMREEVIRCLRRKGHTLR